MAVGSGLAAALVGESPLAATLDDPTVATGLIVVKTGVLVLGGLITYYAFKAARKSGSTSLRLLALGFGVVTLGGALGGLANLVFGVPFGLSLLLDSSLALVGFGIITYSLFRQ